ncbi:MAG: polymer-forming cytoskeletal protein [Bradymonadia bacterium]
MAGASTVIASGTEINGQIEGAEDIDVQGTVRGSIRLDANLVVFAEGRVEADVEAHAVTVHGILAGNVTARDVVELTAGAKVLGDLTAPTIILEEGAAYAGLLDTGNVDDEGGRSTSSRSSSGRGNRSSSSRSSRAPERAPVRAPEPEPEPEAEKEPVPPKPSRVSKSKGKDKAAEEPELPATATKKKVNVKKRS